MTALTASPARPLSLRLPATLRIWLLTPPLLFGLRCCACDLEGEAIDADGDGAYSEASTAACIIEFDCDDDDPDIHPHAEDPFGDGIDQNCDGVDGTRGFEDGSVRDMRPAG